MYSSDSSEENHITSTQENHASSHFFKLSLNIFGKSNLRHLTTDVMFSGQRFAFLAMFFNHKGKQHKIRAKVDGIYDEIIINRRCEFGDKQFSCQVAEDPENLDITVRETFLGLPDVLYYYRHICFLRKTPEGCWVNLLGN